LGWWRQSAGGGSIAGCYLHGLLDNGPWLRHWLNQVRRGKGYPDLDVELPHHSKHRDALLDRLADAFSNHVNLQPLLA